MSSPSHDRECRLNECRVRMAYDHETGMDDLGWCTYREADAFQVLSCGKHFDKTAALLEFIFHVGN